MCSNRLPSLECYASRNGHPTDNKQGMYNWLREELEDAQQFTPNYMRENWREIVKRYTNAYNR